MLPKYDVTKLKFTHKYTAVRWHHYKENLQSHSIWSKDYNGV